MVSVQDRVIIEEYVRYDVPADQIPADPIMAQEFLNRVNARLSDGSKFSLPDLNKRLINLRRLGEAKGGLPRLRRNYNGRDNSSN